MDKNEELRKRLNGYIKESGVAAKHIAIRCNIPDYTLSKYRNNKIDLFEKSLQAIEDYLNEHK